MKKSSPSLLHKALIAVLILLLPICVTFIFGYQRNKEHIKKDTLNSLTIIAEAYEGQVYQFLEMSRRRVQDFSTDGNIRNGLEKILQGDRTAAQTLTSYISKNKLPVDKSIERISVISRDGRVRVSTDSAFIGKDVSGKDFFLKGMAGALSTTESEGSGGSPVIAVSAPLYGKSGEPAGVIVNFLRLSDLSNVLTGELNRQLGALSWKKGKTMTMEAYLVNREKLMITESIFVKGAVMKQKADTLPVRSCLEAGREVAAFYTNYLGAGVAGASMCLSSMQWTLVIEVGSDEVLEPVIELKKDAIIVAAVVGLLMVGLFISFYRVVLRRLRTVSRASVSIANGDYDITIPVGPGDEIGRLSESFNSMAREIKDRNRLLRESEERLRAIIDNSMAVIYLKDLEGRYILINRRYETLFDTTNKDIRGKTDFEVFPEAVASVFRANDLKVIEAKMPLEFEEMATQAGGWRWYISTKVPLFDQRGALFAICGISTDITERKMAEEKIIRLNRLYSVLGKINEAIVRNRDTHALYEEACRIAVKDGGFILSWIGTVDSSAMTVSPAAKYGREVSYLDGLRISGSDDVPEGRGPSGMVLRGGGIFICNDIENDPSMAVWRKKALAHGFRSSAALPVRLGGRVVGVMNLYSGEKGFFNDDEIKLLEALSSDISFAVDSIEVERRGRRADEELKLMQSIALSISESGDFHSALKVAITRICEAAGWVFGEVWVPRGDGSVLEYVAAWYGSGREVEEFTGLSRKLTFPPGVGLPGRIWISKRPEWVTDVSVDGSVFLRAVIALKAGLGAGFGIPIVSGDDVLAVLIFFMPNVTDEDKRFVDLISAISAHLGSVLQRKAAEEARIEIQQRYESLVNNLTVGVYRSTVGEGGHFIEVNHAVVNMFEASSKDEIQQYNINYFYVEKSRRKEIADKLLSKGYIKGETAEFVTLKSRRFWVAISAVMERDAEGNVYVDGVVEDITEHKQLGEQLAQAQKMEAVGQLAGGIAHDFNNILTAIIGYGNLLSMKREGDEIVRGYADHILTLSEKAANLTHGLLAFSRKQMINPQPLDVNELVTRVEKILVRLIGEDIELKASLHEKPLIVKADSTQIEQVLMNLATNARDAMPKGGLLHIGVKAVEMDEDYLKVHGYGTPGPYAVVTFEDSGSGMDEKTRKRIFEPFFTTKEVGKGTGLGLSMAYGIVKQHNGFIDVYSEPGKGTTFKIFLPLADSGGRKISPAERAPLKGGTETVLLAEDESEVRKIAKAVLEEYGYKVITAENGEAAVNKFMEHGDEIKLLVFDLIMPKKNGKEAYEEIKKITPDIRVIFTSGYAADIMKSKGIIEEGVNFISKPVSPSDFLKKIREVLDK